MPSNTAPVVSTGDGKVFTSFGSNNDFATSSAIQPDGKIVMAGYSGDGSKTYFAVARYNADGSLDTSFGTDGKALVSLGSADGGYGVAVQPDGRIVVGGNIWNGSDTDFALVRLNADGSLDTSFSGDGKVVTKVGAGTDSAYGVAIQADGRIVLGGVSFNGTNNDFAVVRYNADGSLDTSFGTGGKVTTDVAPVAGNDDTAGSVLVQPDGKIVVAGFSKYGNDHDFSIVRYNTDGTLDTTFSVDGKQLVLKGPTDEYGYSVALQPDGKLVIAGNGSNGTNADVFVARLNADGSLDNGFGTDGKVITPIGQSFDLGLAVAMQPDGKIVVGGYSGNGSGSDYALVRYNTNGSLDAGFGTGGKVTTPVGMGENHEFTVVIQTDGKIVLGGHSDNSLTGVDFAPVRFNADGTLDATFGVSCFVEGGAAVRLDADVSLHDAELAAQDSYNGASLTLMRAGGAQAEDVFGASGSLFALTPGGALSVAGIPIGTVTQNGGGILSLVFNSSATQARVDVALRQLTYLNTSDTPPASVALTWVFSDGNTGGQGTGGAKTAAGTSTVLITSVNDAPLITSHGGAPKALLSLSENRKAVAVLKASDSDGDALAWSLSGKDAKLFALDAKTARSSSSPPPTSRRQGTRATTTPTPSR